ncbi:Na+ dependent nucleoside transporter C-terminus-domain-containing protein [Cercophora newfieldiana]|uniref:Na+ dependent nucleoside transporter C-terminus-domain-containing protein n=1 Tax=Cercophora newfieldiana TaxID=92897 RepID=A0AA39YCW6_9PEZI|nr:Na+ dependent nucleoside transporter C-terminus-domain-containing protein [Cercophora newfieldiana]
MSSLPIQGDTLDAIRPGPPPLIESGDRRSSKSSDGSPTADEKKRPPVAQFDVDTENQSDKVGSLRGESAELDATEKRKATIKLWAKRAWLAIFFLLMTAWWIFGLVKRRHTENLGWLKPTLLYLAICVRYLFWLVPSRLALIPIRFVWQNSAGRVYQVLPAKSRQPLAAVVTIGTFLIGTFVPEETGDNTRANRAISIFGLLVMIGLLAASSRDFKRIPWHTVIGGMLTQFIIAVFVLRTEAGYDIFNFISEMARTLLGFATDGLVFLTWDGIRDIHWFLVSVVPAIIFFIALVQALYHLGFLQWFIKKFAIFFFWSLRVSGAEAVVAAATPFIGQGESAMLIRPFIAHLTLAEIHQIMTCGFATIAGSVLVAYVGMGLNAQALVSSCIMSIPASLAISKLRYPETQETLTSGKVEVPESEEEHHTVNWIHAFANGAWLGIKIGATIIACLLCVIALVSLVNGLLGWWGRYWGAGLGTVPALSLELILSYLLYPVAWLLGVPKPDLLNVAKLIGLKCITNEFVAFNNLTTVEPYMSMSPRSIVIATYACCGFGNISSLGIQIGILSQLAPKRSGDVVRVGVSALICGIIATLSSASIAGMLFHDGMIARPA